MYFVCACVLIRDYVYQDPVQDILVVSTDPIKFSVEHTFKQDNIWPGEYNISSAHLYEITKKTALAAL